jgi:predicted ATPase
LEQLTNFFVCLSQHYPLILLLDNLHWADNTTLRFLSHLGSRLSGSQILVVGAYRPSGLVVSEQALDTPDYLLGGMHQHPLQFTVNELQRLFGDIVIDLDEPDARDFVDQYLNRTPNYFDDAFRESYAHQTGGNPLFVVDMWRELVEQSALIRDRSGHWTEGPRINWEMIPARTRALIAEQIDGLPELWREVLEVASVQGNVFLAEAVAIVRQLPVDDVINLLSGPLCKRHRLVIPVGVTHMNVGNMETQTSVSRYRFRHDLYRRYLYGSLDQIQRMRLHEAVGCALEVAYRDCGAEMRPLAPQLAYHFEKAGIPDRASSYRAYIA